MNKLGLVVIGIFTYVALCYACTCKHSDELAALASPTDNPSVAPSATPSVATTTGKLYVWRQNGKVFLAGTIPTAALKEALIYEAAKRYNADGFVDKLSVASPETVEPEWETIALKAVVWGGLGDIAIDGKTLTLKGIQPSDQDRRKRQEYIKGAIPASWSLVDEMKVSGAAPTSAPVPTASPIPSPSSSAPPSASPTPRSVSQGTNDTTSPDLEEFKMVAFLPNSAELTEDGRSLLDGAAEVMATTGATRYEIGGHTDNAGSDAANLNISERRADAVRKHLMDQGIAPERLETLGYGDSRPLAPNNSATNRALNRRIEFTELK